MSFLSIFRSFGLRYLKPLRHDRRGSVAVETAILVPLGVMVILGAWELYSYYRAVAVVDRAAFMVANSVAMQRELTRGNTRLANDLCTYSLIASDLMTPLRYTSGDSVEIRLYASEDMHAEGEWRWAGGSEVEQPSGL